VSHLDLRVIRAEPILSDGRHNSSPCIASLDDREPLLACQTATDHLSDDAFVRVLKRQGSGTNNWEVVQTIESPISNAHLRDPAMVAFGDRIFLYTDSVKDEDRSNNTPIVAVSEDGEQFDEVHQIDDLPENYRLSYDITEYNGRLYATARGAGGNPILQVSDNGIDWESLATFPDPGNEVAIDFDSDGRLWALVRQAAGPCPVVSTAQPPYDSFEPSEENGVTGKIVLKRLQGPFIKRLSGGLVIIGREYDLYGGGKHNTTTNIWWRPDDREPTLIRTLPSGGDTSYADWLEPEPGRALVPYYTGHRYRMDLPHEDDHLFEESRAYAEQNSPADIFLVEISYPEELAI